MSDIAFILAQLFAILGADAGLLICGFELAKTILYYKTDKDNLIFSRHFANLRPHCLVFLSRRRPNRALASNW